MFLTSKRERFAGRRDSDATAPREFLVVACEAPSPSLTIHGLRELCGGQRALKDTFYSLCTSSLARLALRIPTRLPPRTRETSLTARNASCSPPPTLLSHRFSSLLPPTAFEGAQESSAHPLNRYTTSHASHPLRLVMERSELAKRLPIRGSFARCSSCFKGVRKATSVPAFLCSGCRLAT